mmetsp:Transcript_4062/g.7794  ORF Transcript_4062/g.7794 Transcript_4062/m.7794 type:complete len:107 (-) Transcript_4062:29-349(-)
MFEFLSKENGFFSISTNSDTNDGTANSPVEIEGKTRINQDEFDTKALDGMMENQEFSKYDKEEVAESPTFGEKWQLSGEREREPHPIGKTRTLCYISPEKQGLERQ